MGWFPPLPEKLKPFDPFKDESPEPLDDPDDGVTLGTPARDPREPTDPDGNPVDLSQHGWPY